jgi:hypothetical protein
MFLHIDLQTLLDQVFLVLVLDSLADLEPKL